MGELWIEIDGSDFDGTEAIHYSGCGNISTAPKVSCPNCRRLLFPALNLCFDDPQLSRLGVWSGGYMHVLVCPACLHYMKPYFVHHRPTVRIVGGKYDGGEVVQNIDLPYRARLLNFRENGPPSRE